MPAKADYQKITTLINRALLICGEKEEAAVLRYLLENAKTEALNLETKIPAAMHGQRLH